MVTLLACLLISSLGTIAATRLVLAWLQKRQILDLPNERSSHSRPTPRGGGLAVSSVVLLVWLVVACRGVPAEGTGPVWPAIAAAIVLLGVSWMDDKGGLSARLRLAVHILAAGIGLAAWPADLSFCQGWLPFWADRLVALGAWVWFINLFNFMDGIDGISGVEAASIGFGLAGLALLSGNGGPDGPLAVAILGAALGFLFWNWHPAKIFLGDCGSVPIGYLLGWLLLSAAAHGHWAAALILPAYYLTDATLTLVRRARRGEPVFQAHRQHFYQQAVQGGASHARVARLILIANVVLVALAWLSESHPIAALLVAAIDVWFLLRHLSRLGQGILR
ncbi:MraY family glycosyltransferase [Telmatospirillum siberiense]|uniref:Glycosyl transferase n=1 Tax=Telmatospirillum siberiense TaxID=382514 RepID=A0A2N3PT12_9PROT|nr:glycosyltransferase family 4 protein [Telmatospirillum siberiense]PKU23541.1 glycosyl transferase [Telmatospirillum siberiense]